MADLPPADYFVNLHAFTKSNHRDVYPAIDPTSPSLSQKGKVIIITGASRGLGRKGFAACFARAGAKAIVLLARSAADLAETEKEVKSINPATETLTLAVDVAKEASVVDAFQVIKERFGTADVLINNAGVLGNPVGTVDADAATWWKGFEINLLGAFLTIKSFTKLLPSSPKHAPTIINVTTSGAYMVFAGYSSYSISKLAMNHLTAYIASEHPNITTVCVHPGVVETDMATTVPQLKPFMKDTPELVGSCAVWIASGNGAFLSGRYLNANWDVEELVARKEEIIRGEKLTTVLKGDFGMEQFE